MSEQTQMPGTAPERETGSFVVDVLLPLDDPASSLGAAAPGPPAQPGDSGSEQDPIATARELAQRKTIEQLQKRVEALEAAAAAEPVTAPSPLE